MAFSSRYQLIKASSSSFKFFPNFAKPYHGKSVNMYFLSTKNWFARRVLPGVLLVFTRSFFLNKAFISEDFPTLDLPTKTTSHFSSKKTSESRTLTDFEKRTSENLNIFDDKLLVK
jgi:hypothetical protein